MSGTFTPGPWAVRHVSAPSDRPWLIGKADKSGTALAAANSEANAHIIAAAPDMLTALRLLIADFADYPASDRPCHAFDVARAAIARAEGGA